MTELKSMDPACRRFPTWRETIERLYHQVPEFREICVDYADTVSALVHWTALSGRTDAYLERLLVNDDTEAGVRTSHSEAGRIAEDYWESLQGLEDEILHFLQRHTSCAKGDRDDTA